MGENAELRMEGLLCEGCGACFDDEQSPGHPRRCDECLADDAEREKAKEQPK